MRWLLRFRKLDMRLKDQRQALVDTFINAIYLYDDKVFVTFNYKEGTQTVTFGEAAKAASKGNGSDLDCIPALQASCYPMVSKTNCTTMGFEKFCITTRTTRKTAFDSCLFCFIPQFPFGSTGRTEDLNKAVTKGEHRQSRRVSRPVRTEQFKSFCALDNHPLFAVY